MTQANEPIVQPKDGLDENVQVEGALPQEGQGKGPAAQREGSQQVMRLGTGNIPKLVLEFAIPAIAGMIVNGAYNIIDTVFLGNFAEDIALAAITVASPIMMVTMAISVFVGAGGNALCALKLGEGKHDEAEKVLGNTLTLGLIVAVILAILSLTPPFIEAMLDLSSATGAARPYARVFIQILCVGSAFQVVGAGINNFIRTAGAPNRALWTMVIGAIGCTVFNALFVAGFKWGVAGSALATVAGTAVSASTVLWYFLKTPGVPLRFRRKNLLPSWKMVGAILSLGAASFAVQAGGALVSFITNYVLVKYGAMHPIGADNALATIGIVSRIAMFVILPLVGVAIAIQPILGFNYGAKLWRRVRETFNVGVLSATLMAVTMFVLLMVFSRQIVHFFGITDPELNAFTVRALRINLALLPFIGAQIVGSNYFQATGQPTKSIILSLTRQLLFLLPLQLGLPVLLPMLFPSITPLDAVFYSWPTADFLAIFTVGVFCLIELRKLNRRIAEADRAGQPTTLVEWGGTNAAPNGGDASDGNDAPNGGGRA